jgi:hypothetical protein
MLTERQISQFRRDGFLLGPRILNESQINVLNAEMMRVIDQRDRSGPQPVLLRNLSGAAANPVWQIVNIWQASKFFAGLITNKTIVQETAQLTDAKQLRLFHDQIQYKPAGTGGVNMWHQDAPCETAWPWVGWPLASPPTPNCLQYFGPATATRLPQKSVVIEL